MIEARDLIAADLRGTSDPYVRVNYGNSKKRTKVRIFLEFCFPGLEIWLKPLRRT